MTRNELRDEIEYARRHPTQAVGLGGHRPGTSRLFAAPPGAHHWLCDGTGDPATCHDCREYRGECRDCGKALADPQAAAVCETCAEKAREWAADPEARL